MRKIVKLPSMSRVSPGATATLELPIGPTYYRIIFTAAGTALDAAHIGRVSVMLNGQQRMTFKNYARLAALNAYYGRSADAVTQFALHFFRGELEDLLWKRAPGIGTQDVQTFHVEIELAAGAPSDITMSAHAVVDPIPQPLGAFVNVREFPFSSAVSGEVEIDKLPRGPFYSALHLFKADVTEVEVEADTVKVLDATKAVLERLQKEASPKARTPQTASATHVDFLLEGDLQQALPTGTLSDFRVRATLGSSGAMDVIAETLDVLG